MTVRILILYYSRGGTTAALARRVAAGVSSVAGAEALLRCVPPVQPSHQSASGSAIPDSGPPFAEIADLAACDGLIVGSPTRFGSMAAPLKHFLEGSGDLWLSGTMAGKPAAAFTSTASLHGGQESTLLGMLLPLLHHGMLITGLPYTEPALSTTEAGGTPYGASRWTGLAGDREMVTSERDLAAALGRRVAQIALRLAGAKP
jgi:NAD(P)H dehydrogenase (quinone)